MTFKKFFQLYEAKVFKFNRRKQNKYIYPDEYEPLKDSDTIRVYHGFYNQYDLVRALKYGLSGKQRANRIYSYEFNNNPSGLFVTISFDMAKSFGQFIAEIHTKVSDLEAPVWPGGTFTVAGQMAQYFSSEEEREQTRLSDREKAKQSEYKAIRDSDRPEVAFRLFSDGENQALFTGELNSNSIRAIWVNKDLNVAGKYSEYIRMTPKEFLQKYGNDSDDDITYYHKIFKPREKFDIAEFLRRIEQKYKIDSEEAIEIFKSLDVNSLSTYLWPAQITEFKKYLEK